MLSEEKRRARWERLRGEMSATGVPCTMPFELFMAPVQGACAHCAGAMEDEHFAIAKCHVTDLHRVNTVVETGFCSAACVGLWFASAATADFLPVGTEAPRSHRERRRHARQGLRNRWGTRRIPPMVPDPGALHPEDGAVCFSLIIYDGPREDDHIGMLRKPGGQVVFAFTGDLVLQVWLPSPAALNAWWRTPCRLDLERLREHGAELLPAAEAA